MIIPRYGLLARCTAFRMFTAHPDHHSKVNCQNLKVRRRNKSIQDRQIFAEEVSFQVMGGTIERMITFKYLIRVLADNEYDKACINEQLRRLRSMWSSVSRLLKREGSNARIMYRLYLAIFQAISLYGSDSWTITKRNLAKLYRFHK